VLTRSFAGDQGEQNLVALSGVEEAGAHAAEYSSLPAG
jgi:hypothetical protein